MKKLFFVLMLVVMCSCGGNTSSNVETPTEDTIEVTVDSVAIDSISISIDSIQ